MNDNDAKNINYYLYTEEWYRTFSPLYFWSNYRCGLFVMNTDGSLGSNDILESGCGVQF